MCWKLSAEKFKERLIMSIGLPRWLSDKAAIKAGDAGDADSIAGLGRSPGEGNGNLL